MRTNLLSKTVFVLLPLILVCATAIAEVRFENDTVTIRETDTIDDDLYVFARNIVIDGVVKGDLIAFGQMISVNGRIDGDLIAAGQKIILTGKVTDDARISGQVLTLEHGSTIGDDLVAAGFTLQCAKGSQIGGEVKFAGYQSIFAGSIEKKVTLGATRCELSGTFGNDVDAKVEGSSGAFPEFLESDHRSIPGGLTVTESANINGILMYRAPRKAAISADARIARGVDYTAISPTSSQPPTIAGQATGFVKQFFGLLLIGLLVVFVFPKWTGNIVNTIQQRPLASLGWGVLAFTVAIFIAVFLLIATIAIAVLLGVVSLDNLIPACLTMGGLTTAGVVVGFIFFTNWVAKVVVSLWAGNRIFNGTSWGTNRRVLSLASGVLIYTVLTMIPLAGTAISLIVSLIGIGSTAIWLFNKQQRQISLTAKQAA